MVIVITGAIAAREGVLFKQLRLNVSRTRLSLCLKTGYLTLGEMAVVEVHITRHDAVETILSLVSKSSHPVARSIAKYLHATYPHCEDLSIDKVQSITGKGLEVTTSDGVLIRGGSFDVRCHIRRRIVGLTDLLRASAGAAVQLLQAQGIQVHIVSGDAAPVVHALASQLGVPPEFAHGGCLHAEKVAHVQELRASGGG
ncbi:hypothetical protein EDB83DRAFT_2522357 [Lactarius deliciosus]|nr:hypothetical protein EDB83DRAFT_2522357 [Lactarius deliciosus]